MNERIPPDGDALVKILGSYRIPPSIPQPMVPLGIFQHEISASLEESRRTFEPFSVLLLSVDNLDFGVGSDQSENLLRQLGLHVMSSLRAKHAPAYPSRKLDVISWWDHYFIAICHNTDPLSALYPINRVVAKLEDILPSLIGESDVKVRAVYWSWSSRNCHTSELGLLRMLYDQLETITDASVESVREPLNGAEAKLLTILQKHLQPGI